MAWPSLELLHSAWCPMPHPPILALDAAWRPVVSGGLGLSLFFCQDVNGHLPLHPPREWERARERERDRDAEIVIKWQSSGETLRSAAREPYSSRSFLNYCSWSCLAGGPLIAHGAGTWSIWLTTNHRQKHMPTRQLLRFIIQPFPVPSTPPPEFTGCPMR